MQLTNAKPFDICDPSMNRTSKIKKIAVLDT